MPPATDSSDFFVREMVIGHRGNPGRHPDNTLAGVLSGLAGADGVEVDVRLTSDGRLVLAHDSVVEASPVAESTWESLAGQDGRRLCLLDEIVTLPGRLNLEVKNLPGETGFDPSGRLSLLAASRARPRDLMTSFYWPDMDLVRSRRSEVATGLVVGRGGSPADAIDHAGVHGHIAVSVEESMVDAIVCHAAEKVGVAVLAWTVNDVTRARELFAMGAAAIISDNPVPIRDALRESAL